MHIIVVHLSCAAENTSMWRELPCMLLVHALGPALMPLLCSVHHHDSFKQGKDFKVALPAVQRISSICRWPHVLVCCMTWRHQGMPLPLSFISLINFVHSTSSYRCSWCIYWLPARCNRLLQMHNIVEQGHFNHSGIHTRFLQVV